MGSQAVAFAESTRCRITSKMVLKSGANWKRPVNRMYAYNFQIGENYYLPMTDYLEAKATPTVDLPGPLCFSERIALHPLSGTSLTSSRSSVQTSSIQSIVSSSFSTNKQ